jgi:hypothetical protein
LFPQEITAKTARTAKIVLVFILFGLVCRSFFIVEKADLPGPLIFFFKEKN